MGDNLLCLQTFSSLHSLPFLPLLFYLSSLFTHPVCLWPSPAVTRICWGKKRLIFSLGRESPAGPLPYQTGICDVDHCSSGWILAFGPELFTCVLYSKKQVAFTCCGLSSLRKCKWILQRAAHRMWIWICLRFSLVLVI